MSGTVSIDMDGRFGNQMFQYAFAKAYAEKYDAKFVMQTLTNVPWAFPLLLPSVFDIKEETTTRSDLPRTGWNETPFGKTDICFVGHCQTQRHVGIMGKHRAQEWFNLKPIWRKKFACLFAEGPKVACHVRQGDYLVCKNTLCAVTEESYVRALNQFGFAKEQVVWVREDEVQPDSELEAAADFLTLQSAKNLFRANSTFSWWAGALGSGKVYSPVVNYMHYGLQTVPFVEGNHPRMANDEELYLPA